MKNRTAGWIFFLVMMVWAAGFGVWLSAQETDPTPDIAAYTTMNTIEWPGIWVSYQAPPEYCHPKQSLALSGCSDGAFLVFMSGEFCCSVEVRVELGLVPSGAVVWRADETP